MAESPKTGGQVRFQAVGSDGRSSASWTVFANGSSSDVYIAARPIAGKVKISLHESGSWRHAFINDAAAAPFLQPGADRAFDKFAPAGEPIAPGWLLAYTIVLPESELQPYPAERKQITPLAVAGPASAVAVMILLGAASAAPVQWDPSLSEVGRFQLADGGQVLLLAQTIAVPDTWKPDMERAKAEARHQAEQNGVDVAATMPVVALIMAGEDGGRLTVEVSAWEYGKDSDELGGPS
ncbi:hypothetical protein [Streptomyces prunicolor]|uniref:hypothetical protein n=1 Tax=Streptomyces prunicolor TaxID=67348 RepID=UPI00036BB3ED|nr:hypothetical protein [Streptomyces prunicolor]